MALLLDVPYEEKDQVKALGAKWNPTLKKWYVPCRADYGKFEKWIWTEDIIAIVYGHLYIVEGPYKCWACREITPVIVFGLNNYEYIDDLFDGMDVFCRSEQYANCPPRHIHLVPDLSNLTPKFLNYLQGHTNYRKVRNSNIMANHCCHCGTVLEHYLLLERFNSPFFINSEEDAKKLTLYRADFKYDFPTTVSSGIISASWASEDKLIKPYARHVCLSRKYGQF